MEQKTLTSADDNKGFSSAPPTAGRGGLSQSGYSELRRKFLRLSDPAYQSQFVPPPIKGISYVVDKDDCVILRRSDRKSCYNCFHNNYVYNTDGFTDNNDQKTCIWSQGSCSWPDKSFGITWVGVHGKDSICVVTRSDDLDMTRVGSEICKGWPKHAVHFGLRKSAISEIDDLVDPSSTLRERLNQSIEAPFGVVCVIPGTDKKKSPKESGDEAIKFLEEEMKTDKAFGVNETIQTAISGLQHLFEKKFEAEDIMVSVMDPNYSIRAFEHKDATIQELQIGQIQEHLNCINQSCSSISRCI